MWETDFERGMIIGTGLMIANLLVGLIATIILATPMTSTIAGGAAFLEMGLLLIIGGCLMSRQPLKDEDRYNEDGSPRPSWKIAIIGRRMIFAGIFLFTYAAIISIISLFVVI